MAALRITGGKLGQIFGRKRAFGLGYVIYGSSSLVTAIFPSLVVLIFGWSFLEGVGAALISTADNEHIDVFHCRHNDERV